MGLLTSHPVFMTAVSIMVASGEFIYLRGVLLSSGCTSTVDYVMAGVLSLLTVYLFWFVITVIQRSFIHSWKKICALDLAVMLKQRSYLEWLNSTEEAEAVTTRLRDLGVNENWDNQSYRVWYQQSGETIEKTEAVSAPEYVQHALREVLGSKQDRKFKPGRYVDSLNSRKKSVTRFINSRCE